MRTKSIVLPVNRVTMLNQTGEAIHHHRPTLVVHTEFVSQQLAEGTLRVLARGLPTEANDLDFLESLKECDNDAEVAIPAYCAEFNLATDGTALDETKPIKRRRRTKAKSPTEE